MQAFIAKASNGGEGGFRRRSFAILAAIFSSRSATAP
jgi:hypothetical protein